MGGCGKTTLAKTAFDNQKVREIFNCQAWVSVSQSYKTEDIFRRMMKQLCESRKECAPEGIDTMDQNSLINMLIAYLAEQRYLIVFDDVWSPEFWRIVKITLPKNNKGSRIIVTTRIEDVASFCNESSSDHVWKLEPLTEEAAWKLFCVKAFRRDCGRCPPELVKVSRAIVTKCEGLPLAIVTIGALLSTKSKVVSEWQRFYNGFRSELERNQHLTNIMTIMLLSYNDLPHYLKPCFLYFGIVPEDYQITRGRLIRLWIAEGFIEGQKGKTLEEVAEEQLTELIHRSLVQVSATNFSDRIKRCQVHDLVREIILIMCEELSFCQVLVAADSSRNEETRRSSMHMHSVTNKDLETISNTKSRIRSVFLFSVGELPKKHLLGILAVNFKLLKVLDLQDAPLDQLHEEVGNLFHLRYLSVKRTKVSVIPKSIGNLHNLQTLNLKLSLVSTLQIGILSRLHKLRHLIAITPDLKSGLKIQDGIGNLEELQTLWFLFVDTDEEGFSLVTIKELENLRQLRKLGIALKRENGTALCTAIEKMKHLQSLRVTSIYADEILDLHSLSSPPESLQRLYLFGPLETLPNWISKLDNLGYLNLENSALTGTHAIKALQALPNLIQLFLTIGYNGEQLCFEVGGFQKLKVLHLKSLKGLNSIIMEEGGLPVLTQLLIERCPQLKEVPSGISKLRELKTLFFFDMKIDFLDRMTPGKGQDYWIVKHIPFFQLGETEYTKRDTPQQISRRGGKLEAE